jgi:hypothetical protein
MGRKPATFFIISQDAKVNTGAEQQFCQLPGG